MSVSPEPSSPDAAVPQGAASPNVRRSHTLPTRLRSASSASADFPAPTDGVEALFTHAFARVVLFTTPSHSRPSSSSSNRTIGRGDNKENPVTFPWVSPTETTVAAGPLRLYRVPGSVAFLHSGSLLHAILPRSQCWCVDGVSKFALRIPRPNSYYRIELPGDGEDNLAKVEDFKRVLEKVLFYEKTICPFSRGFHVDLPEPPPTPPRRKRPVTPGKAKRWRFDKTWQPEEKARAVSQGTERSFGSDSSTLSVSEEYDRRSSVYSDSTIGADNVSEETEKVSPRTVAGSSSNRRSLTSPAQLSSAPITIPGASGDEPSDTSDDSASLSSTVNSFYSFDETVRGQGSRPSSIYYDSASIYQESIYPREEDTSRDAENVSNPRHKRELSELTITADNPHLSEDERSPFTPRVPEIHLPSSPSTPTLMSDSDSAVDMSLPELATPPDTIRMRRLTGTSARRAFSPMPLAANIHAPPQDSSPRQDLSVALVQKTMGLLIGPPAHLVALMLRIAARIANGNTTADTWSLHKGRSIPGAWQWSEDEGDEWDEDDYGIPLRTLKRDSTGSSEVD
ncbi:uncharacterized protein K452DRAFT_354568 [Aplosporella prunicola CBS 121167]|uniref:Inheritance of peroxisomes protein 1 n=1 Tax=Aplosporella prunicola CBS 121167 TaxID=1176127 RepID=A0A6A6BSM3_9PEZI|nr:uncharacterized protein K452DRAFT_354568 [Aplosporella prunicola CBS 121167]KAF2147102.1 hypothetical protein K452DRAFT_354568 [Aplosporella prunicola CBS 121167]